MASSDRSVSRAAPTEAVPFTVKWLIGLNSAIFLLSSLLDPLTGADVAHNFALNPSAVVGALAVWQVFTYMFLHTKVWHWVFNAIGLFLFGSMIERSRGTGWFTRFYVACGLGAAVICVAGTHVIGREKEFTLGASGAVFGLIAGAGMLLPHQPVVPLLPLRCWLFAILAACLALYKAFDDPAGGFVHLGGASTGLAIALATKLRPRSSE